MGRMAQSRTRGSTWLDNSFSTVNGPKGFPFFFVDRFPPLFDTVNKTEFTLLSLHAMKTHQPNHASWPKEKQATNPGPDDGASRITNP